MSELAGRAFLVSGASRGIGMATARALSAAGAAVALTARSLEPCEREAAAIRKAGGRAVALRCDVSDYKTVDVVIDRIVRSLGRLDGVINNAGVVDPITHITEADPEAWARNVHINLVGPFNVVRAAVDPLRDSGAGIIVNVSSGAAHRPLEGWSAYCAAKAGLAMLTRSLALELGGTGIRVIGFRPGVVDTDMQVRIRASGMNEVARLPRDSLLPPEEPARAIVWLCSTAALDLDGREVDIRDPEFRRRVGLTA